MRKVFVRWATVAAVMLVGSTVCGLAVTSIMPHDAPDHFGMAAARTAPMANIRYDLLNRRETHFDPPEQPGEHEAGELAAPLIAVSRPPDLLPDGLWLNEFHAERMAEEEVALGFYTLQGTQPTQADLDAATSSIHTDLSDLRSNRPTLFPSGTVEVLRVRWSQNRQEAQVIARHTSTVDGRKTVRYARWWLSRDPAGQWGVYDFDFPDTHLRFLAVRPFILNRPVIHDQLGAADGPEGSDLIAFRAYLQAVDWMSLATAANDPAAVNAKVIHMTPAAAPGHIPAVAAARYAVLQRIAGLQGDTRTADAMFARSARTYADTPGNVLANATTANGRKSYAVALERVKQYRDLIGDNPEAYREEAKARAGLANDAKAAVAVLRKGLDVFPGDRALLVDLARRVPADEREAVGERAGKTATAAVLTIAAELYEAQFPSLVDALAVGFLRAKPDDRAALMVGVQMKMELGQPKAAGELFARLRAAEGTTWATTRGTVLSHPRSLRQPVEYYALYQQVGLEEFAYRTLARRFHPLGWDAPKSPQREASVKLLDALNAAHAAAHPDDVELQLWLAHALFARGEFAKADEKLTAAMAKLPKPATEHRTPNAPERLPGAQKANEWEWEAYRRLRANCLTKLGKWKQAYEQLPPAGDTFDQLANHFAADGDEFALAELVEMHAKKRPADPELPFWRGEVQFLKRDYAAAEKLFRDAQGHRGDLHAPPDYRTHERLVRTHLRLNRPADAKAQLDWYDQQTSAAGQHLYLRALVAVANDDPDGVLDALDADPQAAFQLYSDPDAAALWAKPVFAAVRQKYPPPVR